MRSLKSPLSAIIKQFTLIPMIHHLRRSLGLILMLLLPMHMALAEGPKGSEERKWMSQAAALFKQKEFEAAIDCYRQAIEANPDSLYAYQGVGLAYVQLRQYDKAFEAFEEALFINPNFAEAHYGMGIVYPLAKRDSKKAIEHYKMYLRLRPNAPDAAQVRDWIEQLTLKGTIKRDEVMVDLYNQGVDAYNHGEFEQAADFYQQAMERNRHYAPNHHALGLALVRIGRYHDAAAEFEETLKIDPRHPEAHYDLGIVYPIFKQFDKAQFHYTQYLKINPDAPDTAQVQGWIEKLQVQKKTLGTTPEIALYNEGVELYSQGKFEQAAKSYEKALELKPAMEDALRGLGLALIQLKLYPRAHEVLQKARKIDTANPENYYSLGVLHTLLGDPVSAVVSYEKYLKLYPTAPDREKVEEWIEKLNNRLDIGFYNRGIEYYGAKKFDKALEAFEAALKQNPRFDDAQRMIGFVHLRTKNSSEALKVLNAALEMNPESPETQYALGVVNTQLGKAQEAAQHYEKYKQLAPDAEDIDTVNQWIAKLEAKTAIDIYNSGVEFYDKGDYDQAQMAYLESLAMDPAAPETHRALALVCIQKKEFQEALESLKHADEFGADSPELHYLYGVVYTLMGDKDKSVDHYKRYTELMPAAKDASAVLAWIKKIEEKLGISLYNQGVEFFDKGQHDQAMQAFQEALKLEPNADATYRAMGLVYLHKKDLPTAQKALSQAQSLKADSPETHYCLGVLYTLLGQPEKGVEHYEVYKTLVAGKENVTQVEQFIDKLKSHLADIFFNQGLEYYQHKQYPQAVANLEKAVENNSKFAEGYRTLGLAQLQSKQLQKAKEALQIALELNPQDPETYYALGVLYGVQKENAKAANAYERYLELKPDTQDKEKVREWIKGLREVKSSQQ